MKESPRGGTVAATDSYRNDELLSKLIQRGGFNVTAKLGLTSSERCVRCAIRSHNFSTLITRYDLVLRLLHALMMSLPTTALQ
ncbi:unnamed protein product [Clavelina lepadiformis]|uniref:Uncharacterized protein n=1 Tax=Clavelina lepadiformis TaxID=159417 RepID=A0ABP0FG57_CLALP